MCGARYAGLLRDCEECYLNQRRTLVLPTVNEAIRLITIGQNATSLPTIVRSGCTYLSQVRSPSNRGPDLQTQDQINK